VRGVAFRHGLYASLAPKPFADQAGNGGHIHWSLWDAVGRRNLMHDPRGRYGMSKLGYHFIAGVLKHLPALVALTCPTFNSYRRLTPHSWSSAYTAWGPDNREAAVRIPSTFASDRAGSTNAELKASDPSSNPYLALGGLIAAGLDGLERGLQPPEPVEVDPATIDEQKRADRGIVRLPTTQEEALNALEADDVLTGALGPVLANSYLTVRRSEWAAYSTGDEAFEQHGHFSKY
jgi:glutamine synthetase